MGVSHSKEKLLATYRAFLATKKHQAKRTVSGYVNDVEQFKSFLDAKRGIASSWSDATSANIHEYLSRLSVPGKARNSINRTITSLRMFYDYLVIREETEENRFRQIDHLKISPEPPKVLDSIEVARLVRAPMVEYDVYRDKMAGRQPRVFGKLMFVRDQLILEIFYYTGAKIGELAALRDCDIDVKSSSVTIRGKKGRTLPVLECVVLTTTEYLKLRKERWPRLRRSNTVLLRNDYGGSLTSRSIHRVVKKYALKSGVHPGVTPTTIRDTFAYESLQRGASEETLQFLLGFEDLSSARTYLARLAGAAAQRQVRSS